MKKITLLLLLIANFCLAQNPTKNAGGFATITGTQTIAPSAIIEARSTTKGVLLSPMTSTQMNAIASPANGLQVTNTSDGNKPYYFDGTSWRPVVGTTETLAQTLAEDNKTNDIPIVSNDGKSSVYIADDYVQIRNQSGGDKRLTIEEDNYSFLSNTRYQFDGVGINMSTATDGLGLPRISTVAMNAIIAPSEGMLVRNTTEGKIYQFNGTVWEPLGSDGTVTSVAVSTANGFAGSSSGGADPSLTISTTATGVLKGNGTAISAATAETDYTTPTGAGALTNKTMSGVTNTFTNIPQSAVTNLTTDLANKQDKGNYRKLVAVDAGNTTHTGTISESIVSYLTIDPNSLDAICDLFFSYDYVKSTGNAATIKVYTNTANNLTGATFFASYNAGSWRNAGFFRKMLLRGTNLDTQASTVSLLNNYITDILFAPSNVITLNPAVTNYILVTVTLSNTGDVFTTKRTTLEKLNLIP